MKQDRQTRVRMSGGEHVAISQEGVLAKMGKENGWRKRKWAGVNEGEKEEEVERLRGRKKKQVLSKHGHINVVI